MTQPAVNGPDLNQLVNLYSVEANLIQQKASHILSIRSLAVTVFAAVAAASTLYPGRGLELLVFVLLLFYVLDAVYDAYLVAIVERERALRRQIADVLKREGGTEQLVSAYTLDVEHRVTPESWRPMKRALLEPVRVGLYAFLIGSMVAVFAVRLMAAGG